MITFDKTEVPTKTRSGRTPMDNPFVTEFPTGEGEALTFNVKQGRESLEARRVVRQVRQAAKACDHTGRVMMKDLDDGSVQFTVWTVERIVRHSRKK